MKVKTLMTASILTMLIGALISVSACANKKLDTAKKVAILHLDKKYKQKFAISKTRYISPTDTYKLEAYPVDSPDLKFDVFMGGVAGADISDTYRLISLNRDAIKMVKDYVNSISKNNYYFAGSSPNGDDKALTVLYDHGLNLKQMLKQFPNKMMISVSAYYALDITPDNKDRILKDTYKLYKFLKDRKFKLIYIHYNFYPEKLFVRKNVNKEFKIQTKHGVMGGKYWRDCTYSINIDPYNKYMKKVNNYKDITNCVYNEKEKKHGF